MVLVAYKPINIIVLVGLIVMVRHFLHAGNMCATLPGTEEPMTTTLEFITALFGLDHGAGHFRPLRIISQVFEPLILSVVRCFGIAQE